MKFLHLSDLHIGRRLNGVSLLDDQRHILAQIIEFAADCDAVLLAGDLYDRSQPSAEAVSMVSDFLVELSALGKPVYAVSGNHDSAEQVAYCHQLLGRCGVHVSPVFQGELSPHVLSDEHGEVHVWLLPFIRPSSVRPYFADVHTYEDAVHAALSTAKRSAHARHVLVAHQYVSGAQICESETRLIGGVDQVSTSAFEGFDYVALGHLHSPQRLKGGHICYCGSPIKYSLSEENHQKAALFVTLDAVGNVAVDAVPFRPLHQLRTVTGKLADISAPQCYSEDHVYAVVTDEGALMDPIGTLRLCYPNLIGMRIQNSHTAEEIDLEQAQDAQTRTPLEHFMAFYEAQNGQKPMDEQRLAVMRQVIEEAEGKRHASDQA